MEAKELLEVGYKKGLERAHEKGYQVTVQTPSKFEVFFAVFSQVTVHALDRACTVTSNAAGIMPQDIRGNVLF